MANHEPEVSSALLAAQQKLIRLRRQQGTGNAQIAPCSTEQTTGLRQNGPPLSPSRLDRALPAHLGWGSASFSSVLRRSGKGQELGDSNHESPDLLPLSPPTSRATSPSWQAEERPIKVYPDLALSILRREKAAAARVWLLLRYLDIEGKGWVSLDDAKTQLTAKDATFRVCGWRQLRNLLSQGEGLFWLRSNDRLWLRSVAKVAADLEVRQFSGRPVAISPMVLTQTIGSVRAHLYASFHSGRNVRTGRGAYQSKPITRQTLQDLSGASRRTQRNYEKRAKVGRRHNFAIGSNVTAADEKETAWQRGRALFRLTDEKGKRGTPGKVYLAWQLPNSYFGPHAAQPRGQQKQINKELRDLFTQGMTGNGENQVGAASLSHTKRFYGNGRQAAKAYNRLGNQSIYWRSQERFRSNQARVWHFMPAG